MFKTQICVTRPQCVNRYVGSGRQNRAIDRYLAFTIISIPSEQIFAFLRHWRRNNSRDGNVPWISVNCSNLDVKLLRLVFKVQARMPSFMNLISRNKTYTSSAQDRELMPPKWRFIDSKQFDPSKQEIVSQSKKTQIIATERLYDCKRKEECIIFLVQDMGPCKLTRGRASVILKLCTTWRWVGSSILWPFYSLEITLLPFE